MNEFHNHILLYSKNWYGHSTNVLADLKVLISRIANLEIDFISDRDVRTFLVKMFNEYVQNPYERNEGMMEMLGWKWGRNENEMIQDRDAASVILGKLCMTKNDQVDICKKFDDIVFS
jgi:hypothetical protein